MLRVVQRRLQPPFVVDCGRCSVDVVPSPIAGVVLRCEYMSDAAAPRDEIESVDGRWTVVRKSNSCCCALKLYVHADVRTIAVECAGRCDVSEDVPLDALTFSGMKLTCGLVTSLTATAAFVQADTVSRVCVQALEAFYLRRGDGLVGRVHVSNGVFMMLSGTVDVLDVKAGTRVQMQFVGAPSALSCSVVDGDIDVVGRVRYHQTLSVDAHVEECTVPSCIERVRRDAHLHLSAPHGRVMCKLALV